MNTGWKRSWRDYGNIVFAHHRPYVLLVWVSACAVIASLAFARTYFTFGVENDYLGGFVPEAQRVSAGGPLELTFHPPLYPIVLAAVHSAVGDWLATGLLVSGVMAIVVLVASYILFQRLTLPSAAWGALIALLTSPVFLEYAALAGSDLFYLAVYTLTLLLLLLASQRQSPVLWIASGVFLGATALTRSNGLTVLLMLALPWGQPHPLPARAKRFGWLAGSLVVTLALWAAVAKATGSPLWPTRVHMNLAATYFAPEDRRNYDAIISLEPQFHSSWDVLTHDPAKLTRTYMRNLYTTALRVFASNHLLLFPINLFALSGLFILPWARGGRFLRLLLITAAVQLMLVNLTAYEARYYLFLVPLLGAGAGVCWERTLDCLRRPSVRRSAAALVTIPLLLGFALTLRDVYTKLHEDAELGEVVPQARQIIAPTSVLVARDPHLWFYLGVGPKYFPLVNELDELRRELEGTATTAMAPIYLYYGSNEQRARPQFNQLRFPQASPSWLIPVLESREAGAWVLYQFDPHISAR
jgi:Dolichyl-phosphate-mannose-protein mannosyltransferase